MVFLSHYTPYQKRIVCQPAPEWQPGHTNNPDSKVHGANMGPTWGWQDPGGPHVGNVNLAIWEHLWN